MAASTTRRVLSMAGREALFGLLLLSFGCEAAGWRGAGGKSLNDDVVAIRQFYTPPIWLTDADGRISGFSVRTYFVSGKTNKGVFVSGTIGVTMNVLQAKPEGGFDRQRAQEWSFTGAEAAGFRVTKTSKLGDSYGFVLQWPPEADVMGRRIEIVFTYLRGDGQVVTGPSRQIPVPLSAGYPAPHERWAPASQRAAHDAGSTTQPQPKAGAE